MGNYRSDRLRLQDNQPLDKPFLLFNTRHSDAGSHLVETMDLKGITGLVGGRKGIADSTPEINYVHSTLIEEIARTDASVIRIVEMLLTEAHVLRASDVHLDPR